MTRTNGLVALLLLLARRVGATTLSEEIDSSYSCYDPAGVSCTCTGLISLGDRGLTGTLPAALSACTGVTNLYLNYNSLTGTIPVELSAMTSLAGLYLRDNRLTGVVPSFLCDDAPSTCDLIDSSGSNQFWCTSTCGSGSSYPCDLSSSNCVPMNAVSGGARHAPGLGAGAAVVMLMGLLWT